MFAPWEKASCFEGGCLWQRARLPRELMALDAKCLLGAREAGGRGPGLLPASHCNAARGRNLLNILHLLQPLLRALRHMDCKTHTAWRVAGHPSGLPSVIARCCCWPGLWDWQLLPGGQVGVGLRNPGLEPEGLDPRMCRDVGAERAVEVQPGHRGGLSGEKG